MRTDLLPNTYIRFEIREAIANCAIGVYVLLALMSYGLYSEVAHAKTVFYGQGLESIRLSHDRGPVIFRFPKTVQTITGASRLEVKPANELEPNYAVLSITPRFKTGSSEPLFILVDGTTVKLKVTVSPKDPAADVLYDFKPREADSELSTAEGKISEIELLKALVLDGDVAGYKVIRTSQVKSSTISSAKVELIRIYQGSPYNGYVYRITNTSVSKMVEIDVRKFSVGSPNQAVLSQSDAMYLLPQKRGPHQALVRIVTKNTAASQDISIPVGEAPIHESPRAEKRSAK